MTKQDQDIHRIRSLVQDHTAKWQSRQSDIIIIIYLDLEVLMKPKQFDAN